MVFDSRTYSVLVVSSADRFFESIRPFLPENDFYPVRTAASLAAAKRAVLEKSYDMVIVNTPLKDDFGTRFAIDVSSEKSTVCLLLVKADLHNDVCVSARERGVFTLPKPLSAAAFTQAMEWMRAARERLRNAEAKATSVEDKMKEIRLVNRAKWLLIEKEGLTEPEAHRRLEKQAMDRCVSKSVLAEEIMKKYGE